MDLCKHKLTQSPKVTILIQKLHEPYDIICTIVTVQYSEVANNTNAPRVAPTRATPRPFVPRGWLYGSLYTNKVFSRFEHFSIEA